jgi:hypothetical protein
MLRALRHVRTTTSERGIDVIIGYPTPLRQAPPEITSMRQQASQAKSVNPCGGRSPISRAGSDRRSFKESVNPCGGRSPITRAGSDRRSFGESVNRRAAPVRRGDSHHTASTTTTPQPTSPRSTMKFNTLLQKRSDDCTPYHGVVGPVRSGDGK